MTALLTAPRRAREGTWWRPALTLTAAGWGANQFAPLIVLYQQRLDLSSSTLDAMYGLYAAGLVPALLLGGRLSDRFGRRPVVLPALVLALVATTTLLVAGSHPDLLFAGRLLTGAACGIVFGTSAAWVRELSLDAADPGLGARRATLALTAGFAAGPFVAGAIAQWSPGPTVWPYVPHLVLLVVAISAVGRSPERSSLPADTPRASAAPDSTRFPARTFAVFFVPFAPWVFGTAALFLAYLTPLVAPQTGRHALIFCAFVAALGAAAGMAAQPAAAALLRRGRGSLVSGSMGTVLVGLGCAVWAARTLSPTLVVVDAALLGAAYGVCQFTGFVHVQLVARSATLGTTTAVYQVLSYVGFAFPYALSVAHEHTHVSPPTLLLFVLGLAAVCSAVSVVTGARLRRAAE